MSGRQQQALAPVAFAGGVGLGALWWVFPLVGPRVAGLLGVLLFAGAAGVAELHPMRHRRGEPIPAALAIIGAAAVLGMPPHAVALIAGLGWIFARVIDRQLRGTGLPARVVGGWALAGVAALGHAVLPLRFEGQVANGMHAAEVSVGASVAVGFAIIVGVPGLWAIAHLRGRWRFAPRRVREAVVETWLISVAITSTAILGALVHPVLGHWTLPTMLLPLLAARIGLDRYASATQAYDQTIRAMSRLPEQLGRVDRDHGVRVATLAHDVGLELGLDARTLADLEHAAHLHELGRIALERDELPVDGRVALAEAGASVITEATNSLDRAARIVAAHGDPAAPHPEHVRVPARILAACCEVDRYAPDPGHVGQQGELQVRLVREVGDVEIVAALVRVLRRNAVLV